MSIRIQHQATAHGFKHGLENTLGIYEVFGV
jgi:hypothetical protein